MPSDFPSFLHNVSRVILNPLLTVLFAVAFLYFLVSVIKLINAEGKERDTARNAVMWAVVGMFVMVSVYGIINLVVTSFGVPTTNSGLQGKLGR